MSGDSLRSAAAALHELAAEINEVGTRALREADLNWHSVAAGLFRDHMAERGRATRACAQRFDQAADVVRGHADRCAQADQRVIGGHR